MTDRIETKVRLPVQLVEKFSRADGSLALDSETWFYNILDRYNGDMINRYGCLHPDSIVGQVEMTFEQWKLVTTRTEYKEIPTFEEFLSVLDRQIKTRSWAAPKVKRVRFQLNDSKCENDGDTGSG